MHMISHVGPRISYDIVVQTYDIVYRISYMISHAYDIICPRYDIVVLKLQSCNTISYIDA